MIIKDTCNLKINYLKVKRTDDVQISIVDSDSTNNSLLLKYGSVPRNKSVSSSTLCYVSPHLV